MDALVPQEAAILRRVAHEAAYGNPYTVTCEESATADGLWARGLLAWAGRDRETGRDSYEWTARGEVALADHDETEFADAEDRTPPGG